jgi:filamentous hemagglutinin family protein
MRNKAFFLAGVLLLWGSAAGISLAQTTNITPSGLGTTLNGGVLSCAGNCTITGGTRAGTNLFHSFGDFSVGTGNTANFLNTRINGTLPSTTNILSRVTGGNPSSIFGTIKTTDFGNANFFLINPAGVVFGPSASLQVGGSFHVSTADYVRLTDNVLFNAKSNAGADALLSSAPVAAFGFLPTTDPGSILDGAPRGDIVVQGSQLSVPNGKAVSFVGGDITVTGGRLTAPSGQINLASVASPGEVLFQTLQPASNVNGDSFTAYGTINLSLNATLNVNGDGGGTIFIRGGQLVMDRAVLVANTLAGTDGAGTAISVDVQGDVTLSNRSAMVASGFGAGQFGDVAVTATNIQVSGGSRIETGSNGAGQAGGITVTAFNAVTVSGADSLGNPSRILSDASAVGNGGAVGVTASTLSLVDRGVILTRTLGDGPAGGITIKVGNLNVTGGSGIETIGSDTASSGNIMITAADTISLSGQFAGIPSRIRNINDGLGGTGGISIETGNLFLASGARIQSQTTFSVEDPTVIKLNISASNSISISGGSRIDLTNDSTDVGSLSISAPSIAITGQETIVNSSTVTDGNAGAITFNAGNFSLSGGAQVTSSTQDGAGRGGNITIASGSVSISGAGSGLFSESSEFATGRGGDIQVKAAQVNLSNGATISTQSAGTGDAGSILIKASDSFVAQTSSVTTATTQSDGGNITLQVGRLVQLTDSQITTSVQGGLGNGGNITIDPLFVIVQGSQILANAFGGNGGNILIVAGVFLVDPTSTISASSTFGVSGTVNVQTTVTNLSESVAPLSGEFVHTPELLQARCAARFQGGQYSSFVVAGHDGLPLEPGGLLPSPLFVERQGSPKLAKALDVPGLRVGRALEEASLVLAPLELGCAS